MRLPVYFKRRKGASPADMATIGSDSAPTITTGSIKNQDNILSHRLARPMKRVVLGYRYEGVGVAVTLPVTLYAFDEGSGMWFQASSGTLTNGQLTYLRVPVPCDLPQVAANMSVPAHGVDVMIIVADNASPDGTIHVVAGPCMAEF